VKSSQNESSRPINKAASISQLVLCELFSICKLLNFSFQEPSYRKSMKTLLRTCSENICFILGY
jgi:hypothetical protein